MGLFPKTLKRSKILPIFKSKDKPDITNFRLISILLVISKVYEFFFVKVSITISLLAIYYHHLNVVSDQAQAPNMLY